MHRRITVLFVTSLAALSLFPAVAWAHDDPLAPAPGQSVARPSGVPQYGGQQQVGDVAPAPGAQSPVPRPPAPVVALAVAGIALAGSGVVWALVRRRRGGEASDLDAELIALVAGQERAEVSRGSSRS